MVASGALGRFQGLPWEDVPPTPWGFPELLDRFYTGPVLRSWLSSQGVDVSRITETSGLRDPADNDRVGGVGNSAHMHGLGKDYSGAQISARGSELAAAFMREFPDSYAYFSGRHLHMNLSRALGWSLFGRALLVLVVFLYLGVRLWRK